MDFMDRPIAKLLSYWRETYGLAMTAHLLVHVTDKSWPELRTELARRYDNGVYRMLNCPDINAPVFYVDYPFPIWQDQVGAVYREPELLNRVDRQMETYPPSEGYVGVRGQKGQKRLWFRDVARDKRGRLFEEITPKEIVEDLKNVWQRVSGE